LDRISSTMATVMEAQEMAVGRRNIRRLADSLMEDSKILLHQSKIMGFLNSLVVLALGQMVLVELALGHTVLVELALGHLFLVELSLGHLFLVELALGHMVLVELILGHMVLLELILGHMVLLELILGHMVLLELILGLMVQEELALRHVVLAIMDSIADIKTLRVRSSILFKILSLTHHPYHADFLLITAIVKK
jgi:hypothetical protein